MAYLMKIAALILVIHLPFLSAMEEQALRVSQDRRTPVSEEDPLIKSNDIRIRVTRTRTLLSRVRNALIEEIKKYLPQAAIADQLGKCTDIPDLIAYIGYAFQGHSTPDSVALLTNLHARYERNELAAELLTSVQKQQVAASLVTVCDECLSILEDSESYNCNESLCTIFEKAHKYLLPVLIVAYLIYLAYEPIIHQNFTLLRERATLQAAPAYGLLWLYVMLYCLKRSITGSFFGSYNREAVRIHESIANAHSSLKTLKPVLEAAAVSNEEIIQIVTLKSENNVSQ